MPESNERGPPGHQTTNRFVLPVKSTQSTNQTYTKKESSFMKKIIHLVNAEKADIDSFQNSVAQETWELVQIAVEENNTKAEGRKIKNGTVSFSLKNDEVAEAVVSSLKEMGFDARIKSMKEALLESRAERRSTVARVA